MATTEPPINATMHRFLNSLRALLQRYRSDGVITDWNLRDYDTRVLITFTLIGDLPEERRTLNVDVSGNGFARFGDYQGPLDMVERELDTLIEYVTGRNMAHTNNWSTGRGGGNTAAQAREREEQRRNDRARMLNVAGANAYTAPEYPPLTTTPRANTRFNWSNTGMATTEFVTREMFDTALRQTTTTTTPRQIPNTEWVGGAGGLGGNGNVGGAAGAVGTNPTLRDIAGRGPIDYIRTNDFITAPGGIGIQPTWNTNVTLDGTNARPEQWHTTGAIGAGGGGGISFQTSSFTKAEMLDLLKSCLSMKVSVDNSDGDIDVSVELFLVNDDGTQTLVASDQDSITLD